MRFLAIGECMAELAPTATDGDFRLGFAGDTFNTAWYLARCAPTVDVSYLTAVGDDPLSAQLQGFLRDSRISDRHLQIVPGKTLGMYLISLDKGERSFSYWRGQSAARGLAADRAGLDAALAQSDMVYFSGITLAILPQTHRQTLLAALGQARAAGKTIAFDPNLRPRLWSSGAEMTRTIMAGAAVCDIALPSFEDDARWFGDANPMVTAERYRAAGALTVVVKNGSDPVLYAEGTQTGQIAVRAVDQLVDSTAAGDSFNAGLFARHVAGDTLEGGISYACALSRAVVQKRGALVPVDAAELSQTITTG